MLVCGDIDGRITLMRAYRPLVHRELCIACGTCADFCRHGSIRRRRAGTLHTDLQKCMGCGLCSRACPEGAIEMAEIGGIAALA
jgi:pyruvate ferredoxin oxidoreductase delta subunit